MLPLPPRNNVLLEKRRLHRRLMSAQPARLGPHSKKLLCCNGPAYLFLHPHPPHVRQLTSAFNPWLIHALPREHLIRARFKRKAVAFAYSSLTRSNDTTKPDDVGILDRRVAGPATCTERCPGSLAAICPSALVFCSQLLSATFSTFLPWPATSAYRRLLA
ncbi:hypothetical protein ACJQWK_00270 [Exserohilum turcicum]